jgi:hypothetical protein
MNGLAILNRTMAPATSHLIGAEILMKLLLAAWTAGRASGRSVVLRQQRKTAVLARKGRKGRSILDVILGQ